MSKPRIIYLRRDELLDIRFIGEDDERTAADWNASSRPSHMLLSFPDERTISAGDPALRLVNFFTGNPQ